ncbi:uncharacterized protein SPAPADRAFT_53359 [Spathaspora passalidarum NRRL Y-27907]|uniref:Macro-like domain-containing protein n=1 Tax=Spathaspora passalidarum (strain NRRL Y-27907 / 11-Y1) TaxID=619300 RepID=G3AFK7_SPAPN|nr:uncharacterized protein SPAPADRAFT_53359 [Spathaspora passalidarum NRRL Y-27907]EGW34996.1 hypothetical protein SPAPADRAFT_53359 [Spathaspora passalidarum NRRL Y-27907]
MKIILIDSNPIIVKCWKLHYSHIVKYISRHNLQLIYPHDYQFHNLTIEDMIKSQTFTGTTSVVTPTNSLCYMGGGFDLYLLKGMLLGTNITSYKHIENILQHHQMTKHHGYLSPNTIYKIDLVKVFENQYDYKSSTIYQNWNLVEMAQLPTMVVPEMIHRMTHIFDGLWNLLHEYHGDATDIDNLVIPGIGTGYGHLDEYESTKLMIFTFFIYNLKLDSTRLDQLRKSCLILFFFNKDYHHLRNTSDIEEIENCIVTGYGKEKRKNLKEDTIMEFEELFKCVKID